VKVFDNLTISTNGFEVAKFSDCYHRNNLVNLNGVPYVFQHDDWKKVEEAIIPIKNGFISDFTYSADNSLDTFINMDGDSVNFMDHIGVLADIVAVISEHEKDSSTGNPHASAALIPAHEKENNTLLQNIATWLKYLGGISIASVAILLIFKLIGGQTVLQTMWSCVGLPPWASNVLSGKFLSACTDNTKRNNEAGLINSYSMIDINPTKLQMDNIPRRILDPNARTKICSKKTRMEFV
jgi:hypothetical protein